MLKRRSPSPEYHPRRIAFPRVSPRSKHQRQNRTAYQDRPCRRPETALPCPRHISHSGVEKKRKKKTLYRHFRMTSLDRHALKRRGVLALPAGLGGPSSPRRRRRSFQRGGSLQPAVWVPTTPLESTILDRGSLEYCRVEQGGAEQGAGREPPPACTVLMSRRPKPLTRPPCLSSQRYPASQGSPQAPRR